MDAKRHSARFVRATLLTSACVVGVVSGVGGLGRPSAAWAAPNNELPGSALDRIPAPPPTFPANNVTVVERLATPLPRDLRLRTHDGTEVALADLLNDELPTILTFNYSDCPQLCSLQLNAMTAGLAKAKWRLGEQFKVLTVVLDPDETPATAAKTRAKYLERMPEGSRASGWTFAVAAIPGDDASIRRIAQAVGFQYEYIPERAEFAHPAALIMLSSRGVVNQYVYGVDLAPETLNTAITYAGAAEPQTASGFMLRCFHWDPSAKDHSNVAVVAMRIGAALAVLLLTGLFTWLFLRRHRRGARVVGVTP